MNLRILGSTTALFGFVALFALGGEATAQSNSPASKAYMDAMSKMQSNMPKDMTGDPDVDFAQTMIPHHRSATEMAQILVKNGKDPELRKMAQKMMEDQKKEIVELQEWLKKHGK